MMLREITEKEALEIITDPEVYDRISYDGAPKIPSLTNGRFVGGFLKRKLFGCVIYYNFEECETCHINVLKNFRGRYGWLFGKKALKYRGGKPLFTMIPACFDDVKKYAESFGFKLFKTVDCSWVKNKTIYSVDIMRLL